MTVKKFEYSCFCNSFMTNELFWNHHSANNQSSCKLIKSLLFLQDYNSIFWWWQFFQKKMSFFINRLNCITGKTGNKTKGTVLVHECGYVIENIQAKITWWLCFFLPFWKKPTSIIFCSGLVIQMKTHMQ